MNKLKSKTQSSSEASTERALLKLDGILNKIGRKKPPTTAELVKQTGLDERVVSAYVSSYKE